MKNKILFLFLILLGSLSAQSFTPEVHFNSEDLKNLSTLKVLAVMVDFQVDRDETTFGNGKFESIYSKDYGNTIIDPVPHNQSYFQNHLKFAENYFKKVSKGAITDFSYTVLPDIITVSKTMRNYSPLNKSTTYNELGTFSQEVWNKVDSAYGSTINFNDYNVFIIFHAGVGRDISLPGSLGNEKDLPSVYLGPKSLRKIFGDNFQGFTVGGRQIDHTIILPETESRELSSLNQTYLLELSINGLLVSSIASHLGLPDLFDTKTGLSAIGRMGLMDGQAIFSYNGLFPPEPSIWEKQYLGWRPSIVSNSNTTDYRLTGSQNLIDSSYIRVNISDAEYYLLENRRRDFNSNGCIVKYVIGTDTLTKIFIKDTTGFLSYDIADVEGVVIDVDEFDWALPGEGILIWHIDNNIITANLDSNRINADIDNRGVDVEEADGIQDIGVEFTSVLGDKVVGEGENIDFWFQENKSRLYKNRFSHDTRPDTKSNSGAYSTITIKDFSVNSNLMTFKITTDETPVALESQINASLNIKSINVTDPEFNLINYSDSLSAYYNNFNNTLISKRSINQPTASIKSENRSYSVIADTSMFTMLVFEQGNLIADNQYSFTNITAKRIWIEFKESLLNVHLITEKEFWTFRIDPITFALISSTLRLQLTNTSFSNNVSYANDSLNYLEVNNESKYIFRNVTLNSAIEPQLITTLNNRAEEVNFIKAGNEVYVFEGDNYTNFSIESDASNFSAGDINNDGNPYIVYTSGNLLNVKSKLGNNANNFPYVSSYKFNPDIPVYIAEFAGDANPELLAFTEDGNVIAVDASTGKILPGFPFAIGLLTSSPVIYSNANGTFLIASTVEITGDPVSIPVNKLNLYSIGRAGNMQFSEIYGNSSKTNIVNISEGKNLVKDFFPEAMAYNYPNPVTENSTNIRYYVSEDSKIRIKIMDLAGDLVAELTDEATGGFENETVWNVSDIQSGVYLARVEATGISGKSGSKTIKIAVIK